jgi:hypothetical protein
MVFWCSIAVALVFADFGLACLAGWYLHQLPSFNVDQIRKAA